MNVNLTLRILQDATTDIELVGSEPQTDWGDEYLQVLRAFAALDAWISQGNPLPIVWAVHHPGRRSEISRLLPRPRQEPEL